MGGFPQNQETATVLSMTRAETTLRLHDSTDLMEAASMSLQESTDTDWRLCAWVGQRFFASMAWWAAQP